MEKEGHVVENLRFLGDTMAVTIDGRERSYSLAEISDILDKASTEERGTFEISSSGYGIRWPPLDEDLSVDGLLGIIHDPDRVLQPLSAKLKWRHLPGLQTGG